MRTSPQDTHRALVVEPDPVTRELLAQVLRMGGFAVEAAATGERGLLILREERHRVDWLVSRVALPGLACGWVLADEFRALHPDRPALLVLDGATEERGFEAGLVVRGTATAVEVLDALKRIAAHEAVPCGALARAA
jgi:CheY-like chemotaxis protein